MRELIPTINVVRTGDGWMAIVSWMDDTAGITGQLTADGDQVGASVDALARVVRALQWPWIRMPGLPLAPCLWIESQMTDLWAALSDWARTEGWSVAMSPADTS